MRQSIKIGLLAVALNLTLGLGASVAEPVTLRFSTAGVPATNSLYTQVFEAWAKRVNAASDGTLNIEVVPGTTLANPRNVWERVTSGVADIGWGIHGAVGLPFPKTLVGSLPLVVDDIVGGSVALWRLYQSGLISDEYKNVKVLALITAPPSGLHSKNKITSLADISGLKVRAADKISADTISALGAAPISISTPDTYQALNQGVVSTVLIGWTAVGIFKLYEVTNEHLDVPLGCPPGFIIMNSSAYAKLPAKAKAAIDANSGEGFSRSFAEFFRSNSKEEEDRVRAMPGHTIHTLDAAELTMWKKAVEKVKNDWIAHTPNGAQVLAKFETELMAK